MMASDRPDRTAERRRLRVHSWRSALTFAWLYLALGVWAASGAPTVLTLALVVVLVVATLAEAYLLLIARWAVDHLGERDCDDDDDGRGGEPDDDPPTPAGPGPGGLVVDWAALDRARERWADELQVA